MKTIEDLKKYLKASVGEISRIELCAMVLDEKEKYNIAVAMRTALEKVAKEMEIDLND